MVAVLRVEHIVATRTPPGAMAIGLHTFLSPNDKESPSPMFGLKQFPSLFRLATSTQGSMGLTAAWTLAPQRRLRRVAEEEIGVAGDECTCGFALTGDGAAYNEEAFCFLLDVERKRFEASGEPFVLMLIDLRGRRHETEGMGAGVGARVLTSLGRTLRDTDVTGWYRQRHVIGAILTHLGDAPVADISRQMADRVTQVFASDLSTGLARQLRVRVYRPQARTH